MRKPPPAEIVAIFDKLARDTGAGYFTITTPIICDHCLDDNEEAFPYGVKDRDGKYWEHLCNGCWDKLGCVIEYEDLTLNEWLQDFSLLEVGLEEEE